MKLNAISHPKNTQPTPTDASAHAWQNSWTNHFYVLSASGRLHVTEPELQN